MLAPERYARMAARLEMLYGPEAGAACMTALVRLIEANPIPPRAGGLTERDAIVIAYGDHLRQPGSTPLAALHHFMNRHLRDAVNAVHILPFYPYTSDDGFSVADYRAVNPAFGDWPDVTAMGADFKLMFDLVINHTSVSHAWFQAFLRDEAPYNEYYVTEDPATDLSLVTRPRTHPLLTPFETARGTRHVWTTFSTDQVDLNFANPAVLLEMLDILLYYIRQGADLIRLDAIAFLWKIAGTTSIHLPQTHEVVRLMRDVVEAAAPWVILITETNVPHEENLSYFGDGTDEAHMVYQFALPPLLVYTFHTGEARTLSDWAATLRTPSPQTTFFNFTASHDGIGVRPATGLLPDDAIARMIETVQRHGGRISYRTHPDGSQSAYEMNITYFDALSAPGDPRAVDRFIASQAIMLSLAGVPGIYLHSLLGSRNWEQGVIETGHNRAINREKLNVHIVERELADRTSTRAQVFERYRALLRARHAEPAFHPVGAQRILQVGDSVFAVERTAPDGRSRVVCLHNVSGGDQTVALPPGRWRDLLDDAAGPVSGSLRLAPLQVAWLRLLP